jgi:HK97 family phage prohead protease
MANEKTRIISGYALCFNFEYSMGTYLESIAPEALDRCDMSDVVLLKEHQAGQLLARNTSGTLKLQVDGTGLFFRATLPKTSLGNETAVLIERGDLSKCSFGFMLGENDSLWRTGEDGIPRRRIIRIQKIFDVSAVCFPASPATSLFMSNVDGHTGAIPPDIENYQSVLNQIERSKTNTMQTQIRSKADEDAPEKFSANAPAYECCSPNVINSARAAVFARARQVAKGKEAEQPEKEIDWRADVAEKLAKSIELKKRHEADYLAWQQNEAAKKLPVSSEHMARVTAKMRQLADREKEQNRPKIITSW